MIRDQINLFIIGSGIKQKVLSDAIGVTSTNLNAYLRGKRTIPVDSLIKMMEVLGLSVGRNEDSRSSFEPTEINAAIAKRITERGVTMKEVSRQTGINASTLSSYITGARSISYENLDTLLAFLGMKVMAKY